MKIALLSTVEKAGMRGSPFNAMVEHGLPCLRRCTDRAELFPWSTFSARSPCSPLFWNLVKSTWAPNWGRGPHDFGIRFGCSRRILCTSRRKIRQTRGCQGSFPPLPTPDGQFEHFYDGGSIASQLRTELATVHRRARHQPLWLHVGHEVLLDVSRPGLKTPYPKIWGF